MMLDNRVKGAVVQRNLNVNVSSDSKLVENMAAENTMESLEEQLKILDQRDRRARNLPDKDKGVIPVESRKVDGEGEASQAPGTEAKAD